MRVLHISDLHFGAISTRALQSIERFVGTQQDFIDLIVVTGDWTQRGRSEQFEEAHEFLKKLPRPTLAVPGNHDIPLYNWVRRVFKPLKNYRKFIELHTLRNYSNNEVAIWGLSTVNRLRLVEGGFSEHEFLKAKMFFDECPKGTIKVIACHHPLINPNNKRWIAGMERVRRLKPDIILSGHSHLISAEYQNIEDDHKILSIVSGTSTSWRLRSGEANSFHMLDINKERVEVESYFLSTEGFLMGDESTQRFQF